MTEAIRFSADEILDMAQRIETNGARFYRKAAQQCAGVGAFFQELARQEDVHFATFGEMRKQLSPQEKDASVLDPYGEQSMYLKAFVDGYAFEISQDPSQALTGKEAAPEVLRMARGLERDSIVFYSSLKDMVPVSLGASRVDAVIKEEMRHLAWLSAKEAEWRAKG